MEVLTRVNYWNPCCVDGGDVRWKSERRILFTSTTQQFNFGCCGGGTLLEKEK